MDLLIRKTALASTAVAAIVTSHLAFSASEQVTFPNLLSLVIVSTLIVLITSRVIQPDGTIGIAISPPMSLYGVCYLMYYLLPYLILFFAQELPEGKELVIAILLLVGYFGWRIGSMSIRQSEVRVNAAWIGRAEAKALFAVCIVGIAVTAYFYIWRIDQGNFYYQAIFIEQELTVADSLRKVFAQAFQLPVILLLGLLSSTRHEDIARVSQRLLIAYGVGISLIMVLSSQTRPAITAILFLYLATTFYRKSAIPSWQMILVGASAFAVVVVIQGLRIISGPEFAEAPDQLLFALKNAIPNALSAITGSQAELGERLLSRGGGAIAFLGEMVTAIDERGAPFYGQGIAESLFSLIPRFVWFDKPAVASPQAVVQELLGYVETYDTSIGPITQFYFEGGWIGVIGGYMLFGWGMAWLTRRTIQNRSVGLWITLCFIWGQVSNLELELVLGVLGALRTALFVYLFWRLLVPVFGSGGTPLQARGE